jgi:predicted secreted Zn-dependent protease
VSGRQKNSVVPPVVNEKYEYYEVCGGCEKDLQCELKQKCIRWNDGKKYDSVTNWKLKWDYGHRRTSEVCIADSFTVTVDVVYHLPKWAKAGDPPAPLVEKWSRYIDRLLLHEKGHRDRTVEAATELTRAVADLSPSRTCDELDRSVETLSHKRMDKLMEDQKAYDAETDHGAAQGAVFP